MTTATAILERHHRALLDLLAPARPAVRHDERIVAILDAAMAELAIEAAALRVLVAHAADIREHFAAHGRARLALFRMATSPSDSAAFDEALRALCDAFAERPHELVASLRDHLDADALALLGDEMQALASSTASAATRQAERPGAALP